MGITPFDPAAGLDSVEEMAEYLSACLESGDMGVFMAAVGDVARAAGMGRVAGTTGLAFNSLYKTFSPGRKPQFDTVVKVLGALGVGVGFHALQTPDNGAGRGKRLSKPPARRDGNGAIKGRPCA